jgi:hypothetical protein
MKRQKPCLDITGQGFLCADLPHRHQYVFRFPVRRTVNNKALLTPNLDTTSPALFQSSPKAYSRP